MLGQRHRRWPNINPTLYRVSAGVELDKGYSEHKALAQCWADVELASQTVGSIKPALGQRLVFDWGPKGGGMASGINYSNVHICRYMLH